MTLDTAAAQNVFNLFERAVRTLATGTSRIQERLADAYVFSFIGDDANVITGLPDDVYRLQIELKAAMSTVQDLERGSASASAAELSDEQCVEFARRIVEAFDSMREFCEK